MVFFSHVHVNLLFLFFLEINIKNFVILDRIFPLDTGRKLNVQKRSWTSSEHLMYIQFTFCVRGFLKKFQILI